MVFDGILKYHVSFVLSLVKWQLFMSSNMSVVNVFINCLISVGYQVNLSM